MSKKCASCGEEKSESDFYRTKSRGLISNCRECRKKIVSRSLEKCRRPPTSKMCPACGIIYEPDGYYVDKSKADGLQTICKECVKARVTSYRIGNPQKVSQNNRKWYLKTRKLSPNGKYARLREAENHPTEGKCSSCKVWFPLDEFGRSCYCKNCRKSRRNKSLEKRLSGQTIVTRLAEKRCNACEKWKPRGEFYTSISSWDGLSTYCRKCMKARAKKYQDSLPVSAKNEKHKKYWRENKEKSKRAYREWYNTERGKALSLAKAHRRHAKKKKLLSDLTADEWLLTLKEIGETCIYCGGTEGGLQQDHFIPVDLGGPYSFGNIVPACRKCNYSKRNKNPEEWIMSEFGLETYNQVISVIESLKSKKGLVCEYTNEAS